MTSGKGQKQLPRLAVASQDSPPVAAELATWVQFARTFGFVYRRMVRMLESNGITAPQFDVLATLHSSRALSQQELTSRLLVAKGNVATVCDNLERMGLIQRRVDPGDARRKQVELTGAGVAMLHKIRPHHRKTVHAIWSALSPEELDAFQRMLKAVEKQAADSRSS